MAIAEEDQLPSTPLSVLNSPEPSGTPILKPRPSYKTSEVFGYGYDRTESVSILQERKWEHSVSADPMVQEEADLCKWGSDQDCEPIERRCSRDHQQVRFSIQNDEHKDTIKTWRSVPTNSGKTLPLDEEKDTSDVLQDRFMELFQKVTSTNDASVLKQPLQLMQKKMEAVQLQLAEERRQRKIAAHRLIEERQENERNSAERQEHWETKLKEVQREKYGMSIRLQELEAETPQKRVLKGESVVLTGDELQRLRQNIKEQEALIHGYQVENEKAVERMKALQAEAKEKQKLMAEENASLAAQVSNLQLSVRQSLNHGTLVDSSGLEAHARELKMRLENEKLSQIISDLERKLEGCKKISCDEGRMRNSDFLADKIELESKLEHQAALITQLEAKVDEQQKLLETQPQVETGTALAIISENNEAAVRKLKPVTEQVAHIRSFYIKKVKELTTKLEEAGKENTRVEAKIARASELSASQQVKEIKQMKEQMNLLKNSAKSQEDTISALRKKVSELEYVRDYGHEQQLEATKSRVGSKSVGTNLSKKKQLAKPDEIISQDLGSDGELPMKDNLVLSNSAQSEKAVQVDKRKLEAMEQKNQFLEERLKSVTQELSDLQSSCSLSPRTLQLSCLKEKIEDMETNHREKELEWQQILKETKKMYSIEEDMIERKWELALEAKNAEIERFRVELDTILETALTIQAAQLEAMKSD